MSIDNSFTAFVNGTEVGSGTNWRQSQFIDMALAPGDVVSVVGVDAGGVAGLIAEVTDGGTTIGTGIQWTVTATAPVGTGWQMPGFDEGTGVGWGAATTYGTYGVAPWGTNVAGFPVGSSAEWIWTADAAGDDQAFFRYVVGTP
jgi:hypothetical protein